MKTRKVRTPIREVLEVGSKFGGVKRVQHQRKNQKLKGEENRKKLAEKP